MASSIVSPMQAQEVALSPRRRRTLETNWFVALGAIEISGMVDVSPIARNTRKIAGIKKKTTSLQQPTLQPQSKCDEFVTFPAATILISRLQRKRLRVKSNLEGELPG